MRTPSPFVLLIYASRNTKAFIVPINDYKEEDEDVEGARMEDEEETRCTSIVTNRFTIDWGILRVGKQL